MPEQIRLILTEFADGEIEVQLEHGGLDELFGSVDVLANRVVFAIVTAAMCVGSAHARRLRRSGTRRAPARRAPDQPSSGFTLALIQTAILLTIISGRGGYRFQATGYQASGIAFDDEPTIRVYA